MPFAPRIRIAKFLNGLVKCRPAVERQHVPPYPHDIPKSSLAIFSVIFGIRLSLFILLEAGMPGFEELLRYRVDKCEDALPPIVRQMRKPRAREFAIFLPAPSGVDQ